MIIPFLMIGSAAAFVYLLSTIDADRPVPENEPDLPYVPGSTGYRKIDAILPQLTLAARSSGIPLGLLVGWIAKESGGRIDEKPKVLKGERDGERGYFQLTPSESDSLHLDHERLSTDVDYSINAGLLLIGKYMKAVDALDITKHGSSYYWDLVKLAHTMGTHAMNIIVAGARAVGEAGSWSALEHHAINHDSVYLSSTKHSPKKWFPFVDTVRDIGQPFGFGDAQTALAGDEAIPDPLDAV